MTDNQEDFLPIREISRITGINTVTLRAWERRYGLLKPKRTEKGHRLYTNTDVQRIQQVQYWLNKGLAISKVNSLVKDLDASQVKLEFSSVWQQKIHDIKKYSMELNRGKLDRELEELFSEYPVELLADQLIVPLLYQPNPSQYPQEAVSAFFNSVLTEQLGRMQYRQRQTARGKRCLVILSNPAECGLYSFLLSYALLVSGFRSEVLFDVSPEHLVYAVNKLKIDFVLIIGFGKINQLLLNQYLQAITRQSQCLPVLLGAIANYWNTLEQSSIGFSSYQELMQFMLQEAGNGE